MNELQINETMTSLELAKLTGKRHHNLLRDIKQMEQGWINSGAIKFDCTFYRDKSNRQGVMYQLNKTQCLYVISKFNDEVRAKVILRWEELEKSRLPIDFTDPNTILRIAENWKREKEKREDAEERIALQEAELTKSRKKVSYHDTVLESKNAHPITIIAKELGMSAKKLNEILRSKKIQYKVGRAWVLSSKYQNQEYTKTKTHTYFNDNGEEKSSIQTVWTEKGRKFIHEVLEKEKVKI